MTNEPPAEFTQADREILEARTRALAARKERAERAGLLSVISLRVGGEAYAIPASAVRAVAALTRLSPLPHAPPEVAGLTVRGGEILPVFHLRAVLGLALSALPEHSRMVLLGEEAEALALIVDAVEGVHLLDPAALSDPPLTLTPSARALVRGVDAAGVPLLDAAALLASPRLIIDIPPPLQGGVDAAPGSAKRDPETP